MSTERAESSRLAVNNAYDGPMQCYGLKCKNMARQGSKYCTDNCGINLVSYLRLLINNSELYLERSSCCLHSNVFYLSNILNFDDNWKIILYLKFLKTKKYKKLKSNCSCSFLCSYFLSFQLQIHFQATLRILQTLPDRIREWNMTPCEAEIRNRKELEKIRAKQVNTKPNSFSELKEIICIYYLLKASITFWMKLSVVNFNCIFLIFVHRRRLRLVLSSWTSSFIS